MNLLFVIVVLVILYMSREKWMKYMPTVVKKNVLASGLVFGFVLCWLMGSDLVEGLGFDHDSLADESDDRARNEFYEKCCSDEFYNPSGGGWSYDTGGGQRGRRRECSPARIAPEGGSEEQGTKMAEALCASMYRMQHQDVVDYQTHRLGLGGTGSDLAPDPDPAPDPEKQNIRDSCCPDGSTPMPPPKACTDLLEPGHFFQGLADAGCSG